MRKRHRLIACCFAVLLIIMACNLPTQVSDIDMANTAAAITLTVLAPTDTPQAIVFTPTFTFVPTETALPTITPTPQNPLVLRATLCWQGPGSVYEVVSALKPDERVELLGRGSIGGWWIVDNPIYHDPCWVIADDLQLDPGMNTAILQVFTPPPTPTYTPKPPTATYTPTP